MNKEHKRDYGLDNIRFFLIFAVVFAHLLEDCKPFDSSKELYKIIYAFHMPAFIFLFGYNVKFSARRIFYRWCLPYAVFQTVYIVFAAKVLNSGEHLQYTTPYWLLWYMLACIYYQLLLPLFDTTDKRKQILALLCVFAISLFVGYDKSFGYFLSLSRFLVFQPWFVLGYYCKKNDVFGKLSRHKIITLVLVGAALAGILLSVPFLSEKSLKKQLLYGSYAYESCRGSAELRLMISLISLSWIVFLFAGVKPLVNKKAGLVTHIGQNTWPVFLLHGFIVRLAPIHMSSLLSAPWGVLLLTCGILLLFGNKICSKAVYFAGLSVLERFDLKGDACYNDPEKP